MTLLFYSLAIVAIRRRCSRDYQLLAVGTLPAAWISICGICGLLNTVVGIPIWVTLVVLMIACLAAVSTPRLKSEPQEPAEPLNLGSRSISRLEFLPWLYVAGCAFFVAFKVQQLEPRGSWDTLFTWVLRARFFLLAGDHWKNAFSDDLALLHPDYPPLLGWALSSLWRIDGHESAAAVASLFSPLWPGLVLLVVGWKRLCTGQFRFDLTTATVVVMPILWKEAASKFSDFALAYSILGSCAWYRTGRDRQDRLPLYVAGFMALWSGLIKNEGIPWGVFFLVTTACDSFFDRSPNSWRRWMAVVTGAIVPLVAIIAFKLLLSPPNDLSSPVRSFEIGEIIQPGIMVDPSSLTDRSAHFDLPIIHWLIWRKFFQTFFEGHDWGIALWWGAAVFLYHFRHLKRAAALLLAIALQATLYYFVYVISPYHIYWHLSTSFSRIMTHVVPAGICLVTFVTPLQNAKASISNRKSAPASSSGRSRASKLFCYGYFVVISTLIVSFIMWKDWQLGKQPAINLTELNEIEFPKNDIASYVTSNLGTQSLYSTQYQAVPTILVVDRRESVLLARFASEAELRQYCETNHWQLVRNTGGLGWARDMGGTGLPQPVKLDRIQ